MAEKKKGFFQRLFGGGESPAPTPAPVSPEPDHTVAEDLEADIILDEVVEAAPLVLPPEEELALAEALHEAGERISPDEPRPPEPSPGPPETTPAFIEDVEDDAAEEPAPVAPTPTPVSAPELPVTPPSRPRSRTGSSGWPRASGVRRTS